MHKTKLTYTASMPIAHKALQCTGNKCIIYMFFYTYTHAHTHTHSHTHTHTHTYTHTHTSYTSVQTNIAYILTKSHIEIINIILLGYYILFNLGNLICNI